MNTENHQREQAKQIAAEAAALYGAGRFYEAAEQFRNAASLWPEQVDIRYNWALAAWAAGDLRTTASELQRVLSMNPGYAKAHDAVARLAFMANNAAGAVEASQNAIRLAPNEPEFLLTAASALEMQGRDREAFELIAPVATHPSVAERAAILTARLATRLREESRGIEIVTRALLLPASNPVQRRTLHYALASLYEKVGRFDDAFAQAVAAHAINRPPYDVNARQQEFRVRIDTWTTAKLAQVPRATAGNRLPVFIVGMPRSGTSLLEQILSRHPEIFAAGEVPALPHTATALDLIGNNYPQSLELLKQDEADRLAQGYLNEISQLDATKPVFVDKMPLNFMYLELIDRLLPNAKVLHCVRDRRDTCLSLFMTDFAKPYDFASSMDDLAEFYKMYEQIMAHWKQALTIPILDVHYEAVVDDLAGQTRKVLEFLGLPWSDRCLSFHESDRPVNTASKEQVKQPLYRSSVGRWKNYASHLEPLQ